MSNFVSLVLAKNKKLGWQLFAVVCLVHVLSMSLALNMKSSSRTAQPNQHIQPLQIFIKKLHQIAS